MFLPGLQIKIINMKKIILLVEDDELDVISVQRSLNKLDAEFKLYTTFNGKEALALVNDLKNPIMPDVILLDLNTPKMNGIEFLKIIRSDDKFKDVKVIAGYQELKRDWLLFGLLFFR